MCVHSYACEWWVLIGYSLRPSACHLSIPLAFEVIPHIGSQQLASGRTSVRGNSALGSLRPDQRTALQATGQFQQLF